MTEPIGLARLTVICEELRAGLLPVEVVEALTLDGQARVRLIDGTEVVRLADGDWSYPGRSTVGRRFRLDRDWPA